VNIHEFIVNTQVLMYDGLYKRDRLCAAATAVAGGAPLLLPREIRSLS
jgi:hypothetical protein